MTNEEREQIRRKAFATATAVVQKYQNDNWSRLRVNQICSEIKGLLNKAATRDLDIPPEKSLKGWL
jgi:hypothetical protein